MRSQKMQDFIDDRLDAAICERIAALTAADILEIDLRIVWAGGSRQNVREMLYEHFTDMEGTRLEEEYLERVAAGKEG